MSHFVAQNLAEVSRAISPEPLGPDDKRYAPLDDARGTSELRDLRVYLENCAQTGCRACAAFIGHRGSGKTTELQRLEGELSGVFTALHLEVDKSLQHECDYTDLLLWLADSLARYFRDKEMPLDGARVKAVADWFAERTIENADALKSEVALETTAKTKAKAGTNLWFLAYSLELLAKLTARVSGSSEHRKHSRRQLQSYSADLLAKVNDLLAHAREVLKAKGRPARILIVQDNLDRLQPEPAMNLFSQNGDFLTQIDADCLWTAPINARLAPFRLGNLFEKTFTMPTVTVHDQKNQRVSIGVDSLVNLVAKRINLDLVFESNAVVEYLSAQSGGSVRDLLRLVGSAQIAAQVSRQPVIDQDSAERAVRKLRLDFQGIFIPGSVYYPLLASVAHSKQDAALAPSATPEEATHNQHFFAQLLVNGSVLEYSDGEERWYDVHPVLHGIPAFHDAHQAAAPKKKARPRRPA